MKTIVLAGGLGTRLRGFLNDIPKPMAPIGENPFMEYVLSNLRYQGFSECILSVGHRGEKIREYFEDGKRFGLSIEYTFETELLGTAGAVKLAEPLIDSDDFVVANGDTYFEADIRGIIDFHRRKTALATIAVLRNEDTGRYGRVLLDSDGRVNSFIEKDKAAGEGYINAGVYIFRKDVFGYIPSDRVCSLEQEILPFLVGKGLYGFPVDSYFIDIGIPEDYERARKELPGRRAL